MVKLLICDDYFPSLLTGFRVAEYNALLNEFPNSVVASWAPNFKQDFLKYSETYPHYKDRVIPVDLSLFESADFVYTNFLNNAYEIINKEYLNSPFAFVLYPGGGFGLDDTESDLKLKKVLQSPFLRAVIVTTSVTESYLHAKLSSWNIDTSNIKIARIDGVTIPSEYFQSKQQNRSYWGYSRKNLNICFAAFKYAPRLANKAYEEFVTAANKIGKQFSFTQFHIIGGADKSDGDFNLPDHQVTYHGKLEGNVLRDCFNTMDLIVSPSHIGKLHPGQFDGFPTATCIQASLCNVGIIASNPLNLNTPSTHQESLWVVKPTSESIYENICTIISQERETPGALKKIATIGCALSTHVYNNENQITPRISLIKENLNREKQEKLHLSFATNHMKNWTNLHLKNEDSSLKIDYANDFFDFIYSESLIEHITKKSASTCLSECFRTLRPNGIIRLSTPNLERLVREYTYGKTDTWSNVYWSPASKCDMLNEGLQLWGHRYVYDWHEIKKMLELNGFVNIERKKWGQSAIESLINIESRPDNGEIIVEASKPALIDTLNSKPRVSVAIASYNHAPYVQAAIDSVLNQTLQDFEIIVTDDGSSDETPDIVASYTDTRIKLKRFSSNKGACFATNDAISRSRGEFIAILSSDDEFLPDKLQKQVDFLDANPHIGAVFAYPEMMNENSETLPNEDQERYTAIFKEPNRSQVEWLIKLFHFNCLCHPSILIRKTCYDEIGLYNPSLRSLPDYEMWVRLLQKTQIHIMQEPLIRMRRFSNETNESGNRPDQLRRGFWEHSKLIQKFLATPDHLWQQIIESLIDTSLLPPLLSYKREFEFAALCIKLNSYAHIMAAIQVLSSIDDESDETAIAVYQTLNDLTAHVGLHLETHKQLLPIFMENK